MNNLKKLSKFLEEQKGKKILFLTTSNRWSGHDEIPKSSLLALEISKKLEDCKIIDVAKLKIFPCEGNVSSKDGNGCGVKESILKDRLKNPTGQIRCWASVNNKSDELYKVANSILEADIIIFFGSIRWGKMNSIYTQLIERLTWLENRHTTLGESNLIKNKKAGIISIGHNWNGKDSIELEKKVLGLFGFQTPPILSFNWQWTQKENDESKSGYKREFSDFIKEFNLTELLEESVLKFKNWIKL